MAKTRVNTIIQSQDNEPKIQRQTAQPRQVEESEHEEVRKQRNKKKNERRLDAGSEAMKSARVDLLGP